MKVMDSQSTRLTLWHMYGSVREHVLKQIPQTVFRKENNSVGSCVFFASGRYFILQEGFFSLGV